MRRRPALIALALVLAPGIAWAADRPIIAWTYTVRPGDTIAAIAARMGIAADRLAHANGIDRDGRLIPGTVLKRPGPADIVPPGPTPAHRGARPVPPPPVAAHRAEPGTPRLIWPTSGALVVHFGAAAHGRADNGIDLAAFAGMAVRAAATGQVIFAGTEPERYGQLIVIDHGGGWATAYAYLGRVTVKPGATVRAGSVIARIGASGEVKKPTLHFELRHDNVPHDPVPALPLRL